VRILLNTTDAELRQLGGDFSLYRDYRRLSGKTATYELVPSSIARRVSAMVRPGFEKLCGTWQPAALRRRLFLASRFLHVPRRATQGIDLIFSHLLFPASVPAEIPIVWSSQGISPAAYYDRYNRGQWTVEDVAWVYRELGRRADALVISTQFCARNVATWCPELADKIHFVAGPVFIGADEVHPKPSLGDGVLRLLFVGIDAERKGLPEVIEAYTAVREHFPHIRLDVVSRPSAALQEKIARTKDVTLHFSSPGVNVNAMMEQADIFLLPTRADTYALAAVEAMARGCATIISNLDPLPEVAPGGETGFVVPVEDARALTKSLEDLVTNAEVLRTFQQNARRRFERVHAPGVVAAQLNRVFEQVLSQRASPHARRVVAHIGEA
jgi:glycosyltransferase involved in cell wall biosynthesis